ncbi:MAG: hypothetical protein GJ678_14175 [Rhodobacteraceae bacterium]|nr:hypothetical protein [Paracoccaceae bacterium]
MSVDTLEDPCPFACQKFGFGGSMNSTIKALCFLIVLMMGPEAMARDACEIDSGSFVNDIDEADRPISISFYQPITGLKEAVLELDRENKLIVDPLWMPFHDSELLVYFFMNDKDMDFLPAVIAGAIGFNDGAQFSPVEIRRLRLGDGKKKLLIIVKMEGFWEEDTGLVLGRLSHMIYWAITKDSTRTDIGAYMNECVGFTVNSGALKEK